MSVVGDVANVFARLGIINHCAARHVDILVLAVGAVAFVAAAIASMFGKHMALVFQVQQCPVVVVASQVDASAFAAVTTVGTSIRVVFHVAQVHGTSSAFA